MPILQSEEIGWLGSRSEEGLNVMVSFEGRSQIRRIVCIMATDAIVVALERDKGDASWRKNANGDG